MAKKEIYDLEERSVGCRNRFLNSLTDKPGAVFVTHYQPADGGEGRIYHISRCTVAVSTCVHGSPVSINGNPADIPRAVSKLERISGYKLKRHV